MASQPEPSTVPREAAEPPSKIMNVDELVYGFESFHAIVQPVIITMILSSLAVIYINTPESRAAGEQAISHYAVTGSASEADSNGAALGQALANSLVIVGVVCGVTFLLVLLYKWRCMKLLMGYMVLASAMLLGYLAGAMWNFAIQIYGLHVDKITFYVVVFNFCLVGCGAIFYGKGIPLTVTQGYLVASSVIVAWQFSYFDPWTTWLLLIMLALYDLFAVLSPCGPLKALVKLMQRDNAPAMPGLLYEANVQARRPTRPDGSSTTENASNPNANANANAQSQLTCLSPVQPNTSSLQETTYEDPATVNVRYSNGHLLNVGADPTTTNTTSAISDQASRTSIMTMASTGLEAETARQTSLVADAAASLTPDELESGVAAAEYIPLALAKRYRLRTVDDPWPRWMPNEDGSPCDGTFTVEELRSLVQVRFSPGGGRIQVAAPRRPNEESRYEIYDREGILKRVLFVNEQGQVYQDLRGQNPGHDEDDDDSRNNIKLGLGDFIFYSILVAKAAMYSFTAFASCSLVILIGLLGTLVLLGVYGKALPALPISIFLGVVFFLLTRYLMQPWIEMVFIQQSYV
ncbi:hypothetical protein MPSEU_000686400 [Mayamaea pseudoterrestris]|nr:hypothetical protein MPSEU_000686400 [Mayamaea pseudoterrestris]